MHKSHQNVHESHQKAAEYHNLAAHAHLTAAAHHEKEDHLTGHEQSRQALEHTKKAYQQSLQSQRNVQTARATNVLTHEASEQDLAALAYRLWRYRGSPEGSPEYDWFHAIEELRFRD
jgi:hypothetical protein